MKCRHCDAVLKHILLDLGSAPPSNAYLTRETLKRPEKWYPLRVMLCEQCWLVQTEDFVDAEEVFYEDYAYFSSYSRTWLAHAKKYVEEIVLRLDLGTDSTVVELAANDGYLLQYIKDKSIPCYGIEPTRTVAESARQKGIDIIEQFFSETLARELHDEGRSADLIIANNVLAHVQDINDFVKACAILLKPDGVATFEFPHLLNIVKQGQFDTIYHEHYSYLSLNVVRDIFSANNLSVFDVEELPTHGGSLRVYAQRTDTCGFAINPNVVNILDREIQAGVKSASFYAELQITAEKIKQDLLSFLLNAKQKGKKVIAYGAAAKGNTILNYAGISSDLIEYVVDRNPHKQGKYMPGSKLSIVEEILIKDLKPDYVLILPWNLSKEITSQLDYIREWGGSFVKAIPKLEVLN